MAVKKPLMLIGSLLLCAVVGYKAWLECYYASKHITTTITQTALQYSINRVSKLLNAFKQVLKASNIKMNLFCFKLFGSKCFIPYLLLKYKSTINETSDDHFYYRAHWLDYKNIYLVDNETLYFIYFCLVKKSLYFIVLTKVYVRVQLRLIALDELWIGST